MFARVLAAAPGSAALLRCAVLLSLWLVAAPAAAYHEEGADWVEGSAYTLGGGEVSLGIRQFAVGVVDQVTLGTSALLWAVGPFFGTLVPNGEVKLRDWFDERLAVAASFRFIYIDGTNLLDTYAPEQNAQADLLALTFGGTASYRVSDDWITSLELVYAELDAGGAGAPGADAAFDGTAVLDSLRLGALAQWRLTRVTALRLAGRVLLYRENPELNASFAVDASTRVDSELQLGAAPIGAWQLLPAVALSGANVNFLVGIGYGYQWFPVGGLVLDDPGPVFDLDFFVRF